MATLGGTDRHSDAGFGIIEIMVSMMLFAVLALAVLPILVGALTNSATNATLATATGILNGQMEQARSQSTCSALAAADYTATDSRGSVLTAHRTVTVGACPAAGGPPKAVPVRVDVSRSGVILASATTLVYVEGP